jgi:LacI family transcriptional regulator, repressor for deo operon, udp, cdd, tsx, nupC, and nupG
MPPKSHNTIRQVAARAGVSHQTVSRVLNEPDRVTPATRARVQAAIEALGYQPSAIARYMATGHTKTLGCISPNLTDYTYSRIIEGIETEARRLGYIVITASAPDKEAFQTLIQQLIGGRLIEGLLVLNAYEHPDLRSDELGVPIVGISPHPLSTTLCSIDLDNLAVGALATQHLLDLGHRRIAHLTGPIDKIFACQRLQGYQAALAAAGIAYQPDLVRHGDWSATSGYYQMQELLAANIVCSAVFAQNDRLAIGAQRALREAGLRVPQQVSVIGVDDIPLASYFDPPLTTVRQDMTAMGTKAAQMLLDAINHPDQPPSHSLFPGQLVLRASTAPVSKT